MDPGPMASWFSCAACAARKLFWKKRCIFSSNCSLLLHLPVRFSELLREHLLDSSLDDLLGEIGADDGDTLPLPLRIALLPSTLPLELPALGEGSLEPLGEPRIPDGEMVRTPDMILEMNFLIELLPFFEPGLTASVFFPLSSGSPQHMPVTSLGARTSFREFCDPIAAS